MKKIILTLILVISLSNICLQLSHAYDSTYDDFSYVKEKYQRNQEELEEQPLALSKGFYLGAAFLILLFISLGFYLGIPGWVMLLLLTIPLHVAFMFWLTKLANTNYFFYKLFSNNASELLFGVLKSEDGLILCVGSGLGRLPPIGFIFIYGAIFLTAWYFLFKED